MINAEILGKLQLEPDDILGVQLSTEMSYMSIDQIKALRADIETVLPEGAKVLVILPGVGLYTAQREQIQQRIANVVSLELDTKMSEAQRTANTILEALLA